MANRTNTNETIYYKFPTYLADIAIHFIVFSFLLSEVNILANVVTSRLGYAGAYLMLLISYALSISIVKLSVHKRRVSNIIVGLRGVLQTIVAMAFFIIFIWAFCRIAPMKFFLVQTVLASVLIALCHVLIRYVIKRIRIYGRNKYKVLMLGADDNNVSIYEEMTLGYGAHGYSVLGFFTDKYSEHIPEGAVKLGGTNDIIDYLASHDNVDEIYCAINPSSDPSLVNEVIRMTEEKLIQFWFVPNMNGYPRRRMTHSEFGQVTVISLRDEPLNNPWMRLVKRTTDIVVSGLFLVTLYPFIWVFVAVGIKISSKGPVLFRQKRTGYNGQAFDCLKFRSMRVNAQSDKMQATENDPRKTKFGDFLRKTSIDELPQFVNVFKGDMSLVGPRPHMEFHTDKYSELISSYMIRHLVKPGITGWAQVNGCRGETKTVDEMKNRVEHDIWYIEHWSPALDIKICLMTVIQILGGDKQAY